MYRSISRSNVPSRGFTLIELLVVIAIIGILSAVVLASLNTARSKGNDAARISDVKSLETAMELYYNDNNAYPQGGCGPDCGVNISGLSSSLVPKDIPVIPSNLIADGDQYAWSSSGYGYGLYIYTQAGGWCLTGVNPNPGWWGPPPRCNF